jgi:predicted acetyltransferase
MLTLRRADYNDLELLANMNKYLIEDENSPNPMTYQELKSRMMNWLRTDWNIDLLLFGDEVVGYALYQFRTNAYFPEQKEVYIRQYFIMRGHRSEGYGQEGIKMLFESRFKDVETIMIDVLEENPRGMNFWRKSGFIPYSTTMKLKNI